MKIRGFRWVAALAVFAAPVAAQAIEIPNFGVNFNDYDVWDSRNGYAAGDIKTEHGETDYHDGRLVVRDGKARADFGTLGISTFAATRNNGGGSPIVFNQELVKAWSYEVFHIDSGSAPIGTPVTLNFSAVVHIERIGTINSPFSNIYPCHQGSATCFPTGSVYENGLAPYLGAGIAFDFNDVFDPAYCSQFAANDCTAPHLTIGTNVLRFSRLANVGDTLVLRTRFEAVAGQYHPYTYADGFSGAAFFGLNTAHTYLDVSSPDVTVTALSGHDYTAPAAIPEPASWALLVIGFGIAGAALRRRSAMRLGHDQKRSKRQSASPASSDNGNGKRPCPAQPV